MSERGFFAVDRGVWDHTLFAREKFSEREAWLWMISSAAWEPCRTRVGRTPFDLERGQLVFALRFLAVKWMWSEPRVRRFLKRLTDDAAVLVSATREATLITICNYNDYQLSRRAAVSDTDAPLNEKSTNPRRKEEETKQINNQEITEKKEPRVPALADDWPKDFGDIFWQSYPRKTEKLAAMKKLATIRKSGIVTFADLIAGVKRYAATNTELQFTKHPTTWLNAGCWADETQPGATNGNRTGNTRATGHDAILAVAARKARELDRNDEMARSADPNGFAFGDGIDAGGPRGDRGTAETGQRDHHRSEPDDQRIREGEIIPPDKDAAGIPGRGQFV